MAAPGMRLCAVWEQQGLLGVNSQYGVLFASRGPNPNVPFIGYTYYVSNAGISYFNSGCAASPADRLAFLRVTSYILPPP
jgi:hypothetical protein